MLALDLIGVKVFRYSDETAEAVASGEKLLKESGTIYESSADMMSPEDAKRYLDFLENGSREGLTGAELAGVEKADALLVSQKVGYEDVWDLRNAGDALESGSSSRYDRTGYQSKGRSNNLFGRDRSTRRTTNLTEWRRSISQQDIHNEMRLFLGDDYVKIDSGKWRSLDGTRQFRVKPDDYLGNHGIGQPTVPNTPHVHFEFLTPKSNGNGFDVIKNIHVPIK